jgi:hypothetical protein
MSTDFLILLRAFVNNTEHRLLLSTALPRQGIMLKSLFLSGSLTITLFALCFMTDTFSVAEANSARGGSANEIENYDIRSDRSPDTVERLRVYRGTARTDISKPDIDSRIKIEFNEDLGVSEVISPSSPGSSLAPSTAGDRSSTLKDFVLANRQLFGIEDAQQLIKTADYKNPDGKLSFAHFSQEIRGVPVFGAEVKAGFSRRGEMFRVVNSIAPGLETESLSENFGDAASAVVRAGAHIGIEVRSSDLIALSWQKRGEQRFSSATFSDTVVAEQFYFPVGNGGARSAWRVLLWTEGAAYYVVVDAEDGTLLWRKNLNEEQSVPATYSVYGNTTSLLRTADSPSPFSPGCLAPTGCPQPPAVARTNFTLIGNESPYTFNNTGWIPDTGLPVRTPADPNITDGNNVEAGLDRVSPNGVDENGWAVGNPTRVFNYTYNPAPGIPPPGEEPLPPAPQPTPPTAYQQGVITHGFYTLNRWHDEMYRLGFTEQAGNFQHVNFSRGGVEGDRVSYEIQDSSGTNSGSVSVTADGTRPRLVMMIWTNPTPDRDGALDGHIVLHEITHALSGRLHGNATGLGTNMARGMGEGWSDFYAFALLSEPADDRFGTHALTAYVSYLALPGYESNYYYGLRRFPVSILASRGPNGLPHNPLTFRYINNNCNDLIGTTLTNPNSAYPRGPVGVSTCDQVHNLGEFWAVTLWEVRDQLIQRHGAAEGNRRALQYVTDGMKLSPINPTMLNSRDAILAAASISDPADAARVWRGFAIRGLGANASIQNPGTGANNTAVTESFDMPVQFRRPARADFDGDGRTDVSVFRPSDGVWYLNRSSSGFAAARWGLATDDPVPADFDGDGKTDIAVFRPTSDGSMPDFYILQSTTLTVSFVFWGTAGDIALTEDFDGDDKHDPTIFRPSSGQFWARRSSDGSAVTYGPIGAGLVPVVGDWDGDGRADFAMFNNGVWSISQSSTGHASVVTASWGTVGDRAVHGDYDGDGRDDVAVFRPSDGTWYIANSSGGFRYVRWGLSTDVPVPGDYDGDGRTDMAVYRSGVWYINGSTSGVVITSFGLSMDTPLPAAHLP